jgi:osmotically inducible protein OsmC
MGGRRFRIVYRSSAHDAFPNRPHLKPSTRRLSYTHMKTIHTSEMIAEGGRDGTVESDSGSLSLRLSSGDDARAVTPEHLFGAAYAACFLESLKNALKKSHLHVEGVTVVARVHLDEDAEGNYRLNVDLRASLPGVSDSDAEHIMNLAHQSCPYSRATRGNINVNLTFD